MPGTCRSRRTVRTCQPSFPDSICRIMPGPGTRSRHTILHTGTCKQRVANDLAVVDRRLPPDVSETPANATDERPQATGVIPALAERDQRRDLLRSGFCKQ